MPNPLWFIHTPKCGGTSIWEYLKNNCDKHYYQPYHLEWSKELEDRYKKESPNLVSFTVLRCPIKQTKSWYSYLKQIRETYHPDRKMKPFSEWLRDPVSDMYGRQWEVRLSKPNFYVNFFGKDKPWDIIYNSSEGYSEDINDPRFYRSGDFNTAVNALKSIDYVFDMHKLDHQFNFMVKKLGYPNFQYHINTSVSQFNISDIDRAYIKEHRAQDIELCRMFGIKTV